MDTLVNRLRGIYSVGPSAVYGVRSFADFMPPISLEAANRIDELEQELISVREVLSSQGDKSCLGSGYPVDPDTCAPWPVVDEVINSITKRLINTDKG